MADPTKLQRKREQAFAAVQSALLAKVKNEDKPTRASRQLAGLVKFRDEWDTAKLGKLEHALAIWAYDKPIAFLPQLPHAQDMLLARLILRQSKGVGSEWGIVLWRIRKNRSWLKKAQVVGIREAARQAR